MVRAPLWTAFSFPVVSIKCYRLSHASQRPEAGAERILAKFCILFFLSLTLGKSGSLISPPGSHASKVSIAEMDQTEESHLGY